jgi:hypothetical protein
VVVQVVVVLWCSSLDLWQPGPGHLAEVMVLIVVAHIQYDLCTCVHIQQLQSVSIVKMIRYRRQHATGTRVSN